MSANYLQVGDLVPWFKARTRTNPQYAFNSVGGRYVVLLFFGSTADGQARTALSLVDAHAQLFDDEKAAFFGVSIDPKDEDDDRLAPRLPGRRYFLDFDHAVSQAFGAFDPSTAVYAPFWLVLDPQLRVMARFELSDAPNAMQFIKTLPHPDQHAGCSVNAPVLIVPRIFEPAFCRKLIDLFEANGGSESGFMREVDGKTVLALDPSHKQRSDYDIGELEVQASARARISRALLPLIDQAFTFKVTRMERSIVACYDAAEGGHFRAHRDNTTAGTAHRRFACTINLNAEEYEGGDLRFPEFGSRTYRAPTGGAVVFSCSLLHEATAVTAGRRYAFLPFFYDEAAASIRATNNKHLGDGVGTYRNTKGKPVRRPKRR